MPKHTTEKLSPKTEPLGTLGGERERAEVLGGRRRVSGRSARGGAQAERGESEAAPRVLASALKKREKDSEKKKEQQPASDPSKRHRQTDSRPASLSRRRCRRAARDGRTRWHGSLQPRVGEVRSVVFPGSRTYTAHPHKSYAGPRTHQASPPAHATGFSGRARVPPRQNHLEPASSAALWGGEEAWKREKSKVRGSRAARSKAEALISNHARTERSDRERPPSPLRSNGRSQASGFRCIARPRSASVRADRPSTLWKTAGHDVRPEHAAPAQSQASRKSAKKIREMCIKL